MGRSKHRTVKERVLALLRKRDNEARRKGRFDGGWVTTDAVLFCVDGLPYVDDLYERRTSSSLRRLREMVNDGTVNVKTVKRYGREVSAYRIAR